MRISLHGLWALCLLMLFAAGALAQGGGIPRGPYVAGEVLVWAKPGAATQADVGNLAVGANAALVRPLLMQDVYLLRVKGTGSAVATDEQVGAAIDALTATGKFQHVGVNKKYTPDDSVPNDPRYKDQWALPMMNMPKAWDIEKGKDTVIAYVIDSGCDVNHPDLKDRIAGKHNFADPANPDDVTDNVPHGTHVAGIIAASTDNAVGVAGVAWQGVKLWIAKAGDAAPTGAALIDAITYARTNVNKAGTRVVINMSLGSAAASDEPDLTDPLNAAILAGANENIIFTLSAGNGYIDQGNPPHSPSNMSSKSPNIFCVASVGPTKQHAPYSNARPNTTIATPGGDSTLGASGAILSTLPSNTYGYEEGTSMAAPACAGVVALLLSAGVEPVLVKDIITSSADHLGMAVPNPMYGYGIADAYAALQNIMSVTILAPEGTGGKASGQVGTPAPVETLRPSFSIAVRQLTPSQVTVTIDGQTVPASSWTISDVKSTTTDDQGNVIPTSFTISFTKDLGPGKHEVDVSGTGGNPAKTVTDVRYVTITPHLVPAGRAMVAIPYLQTADQSGSPLGPAQILQYYFGTDYRLARWVPDEGRYAFLSSFGVMDPGFIPPAQLMPTANGTTPVFPLGLGFWSDVETAKPILTYGAPVTGVPIDVPLVGVGAGSVNGVSWNMIGDPFPFDVPFNSLLVQTAGGLLPIADAANQGLILPNLYTYDPTYGYTYNTLPDGTLRAWTGYWVGVTSRSNITLVVPPARLTRAATVSRAPGRPAVAGDGWLVQLSASTGRLRDTYNFVGVSSKASDGYDRSDVPKPPSVSPYVALGVQHDDWTGHVGRYAQDVRAPGSAKTWSVVISTDQKNAPVTLSWGAAATLPRNQGLMLKDEATGQVVDMRTRSAYTFTSGSDGGDRRFTVTSGPANTGIVRVSNVVVRPASGRASGASAIDFTLSGDASYEVKVLGSNGAAVSTIASRAASAGSVHVVWNGKDNAGRNVAAGMYVVHIRATGQAGNTVNVIQPFAVVR